MVEIHPIKLDGPWEEGWALDIYSVSSYPYTRSPIGDMINLVKYHERKEYITLLAESAISFLKTKEFIKDVDIIVPVPPSNIERIYQPVFLLALEISEGLNLGIPLKRNALQKVKNTEEAKNLEDEILKEKILYESFRANPEITEHSGVLLIDDTMGSGATLRAATKRLKKDGKARAVYVLTMAKNRLRK